MAVPACLLEVSIDDIEFYEKCGGGTFGSVYRAKWVSRDMIVAVKRLLTLDREVSILTL
jgi:sterile alpha motif and leucine zipper-containing kinase AZK